MKSINWKMIIGIALLLMGGLTLLDTLNIIPGLDNVWSWMIAAVFALAGSTFLFAMLSDREQNWWAAIPGMALIGLALTITTGSIRMLDDFSGAVFLGSIGAAFWIVYILNQNNWWSIIPAGVLTTLTLIASPLGWGEYAGVLFFLGLSMTFALVALLPKGGQKFSWPWIPAAALFALASVLALSAENILQYLWPVGLILAGLYMVGRTFLKKA